MTITKAKNILVAPLDWGLGHTSRCMPLIKHIQQAGHNVFFAGNGSQRSFVAKVLPQLSTIPLEGYDITYSKWNKWLQAGLLLQLPHIVKAIKKEHEWLQGQAEALQLDGVISDNRYGLFHQKVPSVIMTHQLQVQTGAGRIMDNAVQKLHYNYLNRFRETWVVDVANQPSLGGRLSHPRMLPDRTRYLGLLSRFAGKSDVQAGKGVLVLLSGPEPARSQLSAMLWQQVKDYDGAVTFVEGSENAVAPDVVPKHITYHKRLTDEALLPVLQNCSMVICRSGYSTLMDIAALGKKVILIPTPGQTEQEYLARYVHEQGWYYSVPQAEFQLKTAIRAAEKFSYITPGFGDHFNGYKPILDDFLE